MQDQLGRIHPPVPDGAKIQVDVHRDQHHNSGPVFKIRLQVMHSGEVVIGQASSETYDGAVDAVVEKLRRGLERQHDKYSRRRFRGAWLKKVTDLFKSSQE